MKGTQCPRCKEEATSVETRPKTNYTGLGIEDDHILVLVCDACGYETEERDKIRKFHEQKEKEHKKRVEQSES